MLKNLKLLKGITIALAFVLVLGGGILLKATADAATKTVVYYVSDEGDNTTGQDVATAFTSFMSAIKAANAQKLAPGSRLHLIVANRVSISTQVIDDMLATDSEGNKLPITVTSLYDDSDENMSTIYLTYRMAATKPESGSQRAIICNDIYFKNIRIQAKVHGIYADNNNTGKPEDLYRIRNLYISESKVTFDNCKLTSDLGDFVNGSPTWTIYGENFKDSTNEFDASLSIKNCDFSHVKVWLLSNYCVPNYNISFYGENAKFAEFYTIRRVNTSTTNDAKKIDVHFKGCTLGNLYLSSSDGDLGVPGGINITVEDTEVLKMAGSSGTPKVRANVTYNFINATVHGHTDLDKIAFFAPKGHLYGDLVINVKDSDFSVTAGSFYAIGNGGTVHGNVTNNFSGSTFNNVLGGDRAKGVIEGVITTNIDSGNIKGNFWGGNYAGGKMKAIVNNISGGTFGANSYFGARFGEVTDNITNNISGGTYDQPSYLYMGNNQGTFGMPTEKIEYRIKSTISNVTTNRYAGGNAGSALVKDTEKHGEYANGTIINIFGENLKFNNGCYPSGATVGAHEVRNIFTGKIDCSFVVGGCNSGNVTGTIYNTFEDGAEITQFSGGNNGAGRVENVVNIFNGGKITTVYGGGRGSTSADVGSVTNYFYGGTIDVAYGAGCGKDVEKVENHFVGTVFTNRVYGGGEKSTSNVGEIKNILEGDFTLKVFYGGNKEGGAVGTVTNEFLAGTITANSYGGSALGEVGFIVNHFAGTNFTGEVYGGNNQGKVLNSITNVIDGPATYGSAWFVCGNSSGTFGTPTEEITYRIKNTVSNATFTRFVGSSSSAEVVGEGALGTVENHFGDQIKFITACYSGADKKAVSTVKNTFTGKVEGVFVCGGSNEGVVDQIFNTIEPGAVLPIFAGGNNGSGAVGSVTTVVNGGTIATYVGGGRRNTSTTDTVKNIIKGGTFTGNVFLGSDVGKVANLTSGISGGIFSGAKLDCYTGAEESTLDIKPDDSKENLIFALTGATGLANPGQASISIHGATKPIRLTAAALVNADRILGDVTFLQIEEWKDGVAYVTLPTGGGRGEEFIHFASTDAVAGSAEIKTVSVEFAPGTTKDRVALVGSGAAQAPAVVPASPSVDAVSFTLGNNLIVNFYVEKDTVESYLNAIGSFPYSFSFMGKTLIEGEITDLANAQVVGEYVCFSTGLGIPATKYAEEISATFCGYETVCSVYDLLASAASSTQDQALASLLKAIYNYGAEAEALVKESSATKYEGITYTGSYAFNATTSTKVEGYTFSKVGLSLGEDVYLDFYLNAASTEGITFVAKKADGTLVPAECIEVYPFSGNSKYNVVISLRLDIASMDDVITLSALSSDGAELANCTNSVASSCASYIQSGSDYAGVASALLAYVEKAQQI